MNDEGVDQARISKDTWYKAIGDCEVCGEHVTDRAGNPEDARLFLQLSHAEDARKKGKIPHCYVGKLVFELVAPPKPHRKRRAA